MSRSYRQNTKNYDQVHKINDHRRIRSKERIYCQLVKLDSEVSFDKDIDHIENMWKYKCRIKKWKPMQKWLKSHIGESWNKVFSLLVSKLKECHPISDSEIRQEIRYFVDTGSDPLADSNIRFLHYCNRYFYVDENGLLQEHNKIIRKKHVFQRFDTKLIAEWLNGRIIGKRGNILYWFLPTFSSWKIIWENYYTLKYYYVYYISIMKDGEIISNIFSWKEYYGKSISARQDHKLSEKDLKFWYTIPKWYQDQILSWSPLNKDKTKYWNNIAY